MLYTFRTIARWSAALVLCLFIGFSCSKGGGEDPPQPNPCSGVTVSVTAAIKNAAPGQATGKIEATATGGSGTPTFSINGGAFQATGVFNNLAKGSYTVAAKYPNGCNGSSVFTVNETDPCASTITLTVTGTSSDPCTATGVVTATAGGSTGFTYSLDNGTFQTSNVFNNVAIGNHTVIVKDNAGCNKSSTVNIGTVSAGPLYTAVKSLITTNCAVSNCHNGTQPPDWRQDCNIISNKLAIKARAVDGIPSFMPPTGPLPQSERDKITNWINAGGKYTD